MHIIRVYQLIRLPTSAAITESATITTNADKYQLEHYHVSHFVCKPLGHYDELE